MAQYGGDMLHARSFPVNLGQGEFFNEGSLDFVVFLTDERLSHFEPGGWQLLSDQLQLLNDVGCFKKLFFERKKLR